MDPARNPTARHKPAVGIIVLSGRYEIVRTLGRGGFGEASLARDRHLPDAPLCVVKRLALEEPSGEALEVARRLFDQEARVLYRLGSHRQIPTLYAHFEEGGEFYLVQEYIEGTALDSILAERRRLADGEVLALLEDLLGVLAYAHEQGVVHRDVKPPNLIRRAADGATVLIDFGAVKQMRLSTLASEATHLTIGIGSYGFTPAEQFAGRPTFASDVYAAGMVALYALTGIHPRDLETDPASGEVRWRHHAPISPGFAAVLERMVQHDFKERYRTAGAALAAVTAVRRGEWTEAEQPVASGPRDRTALDATRKVDQTAVAQRTVAWPRPTAPARKPPGKALVIAGSIGLVALLCVSVGMLWSRTQADATSRDVTRSSDTANSEIEDADNAFRSAQSLARTAARYEETARSRSDWDLAVNQWKLAIASIESVLPSSSNYMAAQQLLPQYRVRLQRAIERSSVAAEAGEAGAPAPSLPVELPARPQSENYFAFASPTSDFLHGARQTFTSTDGTFTATIGTKGALAGAVTIEFVGESWGTCSLFLRAPYGAALAPGTYQKAEPFSQGSPARPGLTFNALYRNCYSPSGQFTIDAVEYAPDGSLRLLEATFEQYCDRSANPLLGRVRYEAPASTN